jgi:hypothetical protein
MSFLIHYGSLLVNRQSAASADIGHGSVYRIASSIGPLMAYLKLENSTHCSLPGHTQHKVPDRTYTLFTFVMEHTLQDHAIIVGVHVLFPVEE